MERLKKEINGIPIVALVGPTNAGKSTLFNRLTGSWQAVTAKEESTTRDRVYGEVNWQGNDFTLVDTGGLVDDESELYQKIYQQTLAAIEEADLVLFVYDAREGLVGQSKQFLDKLRGKKPMWLISNKVDSIEQEQRIVRLDSLGLPYYEVSASTGRGSGDLLEEISYYLPRTKLTPHTLPIIALAGRPNVGKSTLLNALVEEERAVVSPIAGTTRDVVTAKLDLNGKEYLLADTAGVRRRGRIDRGIETFSVRRTLTAVAQASSVIVVIDATQGTTRGDMHLLYYAQELKKPTLLVINKMDLVNDKPMWFHKHVAKRFESIQISALEHTNIPAVAQWIEKNT